MSDLQNLIEAVVQGDEPRVTSLVQEAINAGESAGEVMSKGLIAAMNIVGEKMEAEEMFIPEVLMSAMAMSAGVALLKPHLTADQESASGKLVIGTVKGDLHDIGKNLVKMLMEGAGFSVVDLGTDAAPENFVAAVRDNNANIVGMSALLTTTMPKMRATVEALKEAGLREQVKILVGGAPVTEEYAKEIGADGYAPDAGSAVRKAKTLLGA